MLLAFLVAKIIVQTDLIMIAPLGEVALAAFAIPTRVMLIDMIAAFAISPVISVIVSGAKEGEERNSVIQNSLSFSIYLSIVLMIIGLLVYPFIVIHIIKNPAVKHLALNAVFWMTIAIPARFTQFLCTMILFGSRRGSSLLPIYGVSLVLNATLDWLFIYYLHRGFSGSYLSTFITSQVTLIWSLYILRKDGPLSMIIRLPKLKWIKSFIGSMGAELGRVVSWQVLPFVVLTILASKILWTSTLSAYSVAMEFYLLLAVPFIVIMRSVAIFLASYKTLHSNELYSGFKKIVMFGLFITMLFSIFLILSRNYIGNNIYHLSNEAFVWWVPFTWIVAVLLPIAFLNAIQRGIWQSRKQFKFIFFWELVLTWPITLTALYYGLQQNNPWIMWSGMLFIETITCFWLYHNKHKLNPSNKEFLPSLHVTREPPTPD